MKAKFNSLYLNPAKTVYPDYSGEVRLTVIEPTYTIEQLLSRATGGIPPSEYPGSTWDDDDRLNDVIANPTSYIDLLVTAKDSESIVDKARRKLVEMSDDKNKAYDERVKKALDLLDRQEKDSSGNSREVDKSE